MMPTDGRLSAFAQMVWERADELYRDFPWRHSDDPYAILVSEVMLQQTQTSRVEGRWEQWLETFPTPAALAAAPATPVLELWQGMGYNRRALNLKRSAEAVVGRFDGQVPCDEADLLSLPGVGPATCAGVRAFAFRQPSVYLETNVRAVYIHEFFPERDKVTDAELSELVRATCPQGPQVREWYYALLDYGAYLKKTLPNPSRRSAQHHVQSAFEGSHRQKRAYLLRRLLEAPAHAQDLACDLSAFETAAGRQALDEAETEAILCELEAEGFTCCDDGLWSCRD